MISPKGYGAAVSGVRFLVSPSVFGFGTGASREAQMTVAEITVPYATEVEMTASFCLPGVAQDMSGVLASLGSTSPVNDAMDAWDLKSEEVSRGQCYIAPVEFTAADPDVAKLCNMKYFANVKVPKGPCTVTCAWEHDYAAPKGPGNYVLVPTLNCSLPSWCMDAIVVGCDCAPYGEPQTKKLSAALRWDLAAGANISFPDLDSACLVRQHGGAMPFHNLYFPTRKREATDREYVSASGAVIKDETSQRLVSFFDVGFQPVVSVCGAIVRDGFNFHEAHVPFTVTERMCLSEGPLVFRDITPGDPLIRCTMGRHNLLIDCEKREKYGGVLWVSATK